MGVERVDIREESGHGGRDSGAHVLGRQAGEMTVRRAERRKRKRFKLFR